MKWVDLQSLLIKCDNELYGRLPDLQFYQLNSQSTVLLRVPCPRDLHHTWHGCSFSWNQTADNDALVLMKTLNFLPALSKPIPETFFIGNTTAFQFFSI